jgi:tetratricopeptide (TPR) repeat protein
MVAAIEERIVKYLGSALALLCVPAILAAHWVSFPLSNKLSGISFSMAGYVRGNTLPTPVSYGALAALILLVAAVAIWRQRWGVTYAAGTALLTLVIAALYQVALGDPALLKDLAEEADWLNAANHFAQAYLPLNLGNEATVWPFLNFDSLSGRLFSGWYFMGLGWYAALIAALALMAAGAGNIERAARRWAGLTTAVLLLVLTAAFLAMPLMGQRALMAAFAADSRGDSVAASRLYQRAFDLDGWNALNFQLRERAGALDAALGKTTTADYTIFRAESFLKQNLIPSAIAQYDLLATRDGPLRSLAETRAVWLRTAYGLQLYQTGALGAAVQYWESALHREPSMWLAVFYLARGYFAVGRYREAEEMAQRSVDRVNDPQFIADLYSDIGDAQTREPRLSSGHLAYYLSYEQDYADNRRGLAGATGP